MKSIIVEQSSEKITNSESDQKPFLFSTFAKGDYISWICTTQAANRVHVILRDSEKTYIDAEKQSRNIDPPLSVSHDRMVGDNLQLLVLENNNSVKKFQKSVTMLTSDDGTPIGSVVSLAYEDENDDDYNDIYFNIVSWKTEG
ncbi:hypothetical protein [Rahnella aquatilis]|jgi:hypothetical protein|uniref:Calcium-mediated lectin domain-containing protein n=1 Tax=Rahnella aquatilis (strain ATCC 33071 / DSM 4594 / JCM 1683 / NBRC 105701 / NCIMB 13365 / CIP 78.65) TaxID=745277 RepID=H2IRN4_RAHAC|nr:hypothetical protein [Rahnella aquatilis]AEX52535.1 hypothetical protein Rahaq2_2693 [Rahnella aquatilis CIP 78.65 = ATCC 33071]